MFSSEKSVTSRTNKTDYLMRISIADLVWVAEVWVNLDDDLGPFFLLRKSETRGSFRRRDAPPSGAILKIVLWCIGWTQKTLPHVEILAISCHMTSQCSDQKWLNRSIKPFFAPKNWNFVSRRFHSFYESYTMLHTLYGRYSVEVLFDVWYDS